MTVVTFLMVPFHMGTILFRVGTRSFRSFQTRNSLYSVSFECEYQKKKGRERQIEREGERRKERERERGGGEIEEE